ncbi:carbohydrate kinase [Mucilaginibacter sp. BT774]|uniref:carbohydrate kinase family protein n=1 Tax=Mucilaginibacter sp. BT774 TaxID=3062276 RepID=UPI00267509CF|nr:carbohydrate kinase [Mucilaginibacter sp. BT774]MDO3627998.1 carbohydrate kinase [Mucilaginibacter sp. BT774]
MDTQTNILPAICFGEVLWDMLPEGAQPGGAPLNVAYHLNRRGVKTNIFSKVGNDLQGHQLISLIKSWGLGTDFLQVDTKYPTSQVLAKMNGTEVSYEIVSPVAWDFIERIDAAKPLIDSSTYFIYGSLASRSEFTRKTLFDLLENECIKVFDINLRPPFISGDLLGALLTMADIVKFNQAELEMVQSVFGGSFSNEVSQVRFIQDKFNVPEIVVTKGEFGASYYKNQAIYHAWGSEVKVQDTIGSGDSFLAAFIAGHFFNKEPWQIIKDAVAMGAFIATKKGGCPDYQIQEYREFNQKMF